MRLGFEGLNIPTNNNVLLRTLVSRGVKEKTEIYLLRIGAYHGYILESSSLVRVTWTQWFLPACSPAKNTPTAGPRDSNTARRSKEAGPFFSVLCMRMHGVQGHLRFIELRSKLSAFWRNEWPTVGEEQLEKFLRTTQRIESDDVTMSAKTMCCSTITFSVHSSCVWSNIKHHSM